MKSSVCAVLTVALVLGLAAVPSASDQPETQPAVDEWQLPMQPNDRLIEMFGSGDGEVVSFTIMRYGRNQRMPQATPWMLNTSTGKLTNLLEAVGQDPEAEQSPASQAGPSPDGKHVLVMRLIRQEPVKLGGFLFTADSTDVHKLTEGMPLTSAWSGTKLLLSAAGDDNKVGRIQAYDPQTREMGDLPVCGLVVAAHPGGKYLLAACNPDAPDEPLDRSELGDCWICIVDMEGTVVAKLVSSDELSDRPVISPNGKYIAFERQRWENPMQPPEILGTRIATSDGETVKDYPDVAPVAVGDDGTLTAAVVGENRTFAAIHLISPTGQNDRLVRRAVAAIVAGERLFYVSPDEPTMLKSLPMDE